MTDPTGPTSAEELNRRGNELAAAKRHAEAEELYRQAIALEPALAKAHGNLGTVLKHQGRLSEAESSFRRGLELGGSPKLAANLGALLVDLDRVAEAEALARDRSPEVAAALRNAVAHHHESHGNALRAGAAWLGVAEVSPPEAAAGLERTTLEIPLDAGGSIVTPKDTRLITPFVLLEQRDWFEDEIRLVRRLLRPGEAAVDVGANFGVYTLAMARAVGPSGRVVSYEPSSATFAFLSATVRRNRLDQVDAVRAALSAEPGEATFTNAELPELSGLGIETGDPRHWKETVRLETLDMATSRVGGRSVGLLKIDAEGEEERILASARSFLLAHDPLVMAELRHRSAVNTALLGVLKGDGRSLYRLLPGPLLLEPLREELYSEPFLLNVFACSAKRAAALAGLGFVASAETLAALYARLERAREAAARAEDACSRAALVRALSDLGLRAEAIEQARRALDDLARGALGQPSIAPTERFDAAFAAAPSPQVVEASLVDFLLRRGRLSAVFDASAADDARRLVELGDPEGYAARVLELLRRPEGRG